MIDLQEQRANWVINLKKAKDGSIEEVIFQPIDIKRYSHALFGIADHVLLMSATICSMENLRNTLGIKESEGQRFIRVGRSTFPIENRPIYPMNIAYLNRSSMNASIDIITQAIDEIMNHHPSEKGIIHTTSYWQANYIMSHIPEPNSRRLVSTEGSFNRSDLLRKHNLNDSSTLISPSLYQGVDLKDDLSRFQVIVKVPYPDLSEKRTSTLLKRDRKWYEWHTALRLVQTYGRSIRGESDYAVTYILDSNFTLFIRKHPDLFPGYFLEALRDRKSYL
jgi:Rad3-related DNA helicase